MEDLTKKYLSRIDCIIHLGDCTEDTAALRELGKPLFQVRGNNDYDSLFPLERTVSLAGKRIYMTHGHRQKVYWNTDVLYYTAAQEQADAALFGHTHVPYLENEGGIIIMNPGSISPEGRKRTDLRISDCRGRKNNGFRNGIFKRRNKKNQKPVKTGFVLQKIYGSFLIILFQSASVYVKI